MNYKNYILFLVALIFYHNNFSSTSEQEQQNLHNLMMNHLQQIDVYKAIGAYPAKKLPNDSYYTWLTRSNIYNTMLNNDFPSFDYFTQTANLEENLDKEGRKLLHIAAKEYPVRYVQLLIDKEANVNCTTKDGTTPLMMAAVNGNIANMQVLINAEARINAINMSHNTALHYALMLGHTAAAQTLLDHGADTNKQNDKGKTALHYAVRLGIPEIVQKLLDHGADPRIADKNNKRPIDLTSHEKIIGILSKKLLDLIKQDYL